MLIEVLVTGLITYITVFVFFFNSNYASGAELQDLSKHGVYRGLYCFVSNIGTFCYYGLERFQASVCRRLNIRRESGLYSILNGLLYLGVLYAYVTFYELAVEYFMLGEVDSIVFDLSSSYSKVSEAIMIVGVIKNFANLFETLSFGDALLQMISSTIIYIGLSFFFFTTVYGLLRNKVYELKLAEKVTSRLKVQAIADSEVDTTSAPVVEAVEQEVQEIANVDEVTSGIAKLAESFKPFVLSIKDALIGFADGIGVLRNFSYPTVKVAALLGVLAYSAIIVYRGEGYGSAVGLYDLAVNLLDESGVVDIVCSYAICSVWGAITLFLCGSVKKVLPEQVQERIDELGDKGNAYVEKVEERVEDFAKEVDAVYAKSEYVYEGRVINDWVTTVDTKAKKDTTTETVRPNKSPRTPRPPKRENREPDSPRVTPNFGRVDLSAIDREIEENPVRPMKNNVFERPGRPRQPVFLKEGISRESLQESERDLDVAFEEWDALYDEHRVYSGDDVLELAKIKGRIKKIGEYYLSLRRTWEGYCQYPEEPHRPEPPHKLKSEITPEVIQKVEDDISSVLENWESILADTTLTEEEKLAELETLNSIMTYITAHYAGMSAE